MSRGFWFAAGAVSSVYLLVKARRTAEAFTPEGLRDRLAGVSLGAHLFAHEVRSEMVAREMELHRRLRLEGSGPRAAIAASRAEEPEPEGSSG